MTFGGVCSDSSCFVYEIYFQLNTFVHSMLQQHPAQLDTVSDLLASLIIQSVYRKIMSDQHHHQPSQQTAAPTMEGKSSNEVTRGNEDASNVADAPEMDTLIDLSDITQPAAASSSPFATVTATSSSSLSVIQQQQSSSSSSYSSASSVDDSSSTTSADTIVLTTSYNNDDNDNENIIDTCSDNNTRNNINNENVTILGDTTDTMDTVTRAFATNLQLLEREVAKLDAEDTAVQVTETTITRALVATPVGGGKSGTVKDQTESTAQTPPKIKPYIIFEPSDSEEEVDIPVRLPPHPSDITGGKSAATPPSSVPSPKAPQSTVQIGAATPTSSSITIPQSAPLQIGTWRDQTYDADEISSQSYDDDSDDDEISSEDNKSEGLVPRTTTPTNFGSSSSGTAAVAAAGTSAGASTSGGGGGGSPSAANLLNLSQEYHLKWIKWKGNTKCPIVTQNSNGPCPLLAIMNVLLMRKNICFPPMIEIITAEQLMDYLCDFILSNVPTNLPEGVKLDFEQNFQDAMSILPRLSTGLDVNVRFTGISDFEYTSECIIFDLLRIPLYHGWLVDPEDSEVFRVVNTLSYNQLVDKIIANKGSADPDINSQMFIAEEFLNQSASQLTNHGLVQLIQRVKEDELCILFRNNHFITLYKYKGKLFQLVTDQGFLTEPNVVWESLNNIEGDTYFVDGDFVLVPPKPAIAMAVTPFVDTQQQIDQDYLIALSLEQEQKQEWERTAASAPEGSTSSTSTSTGSTGQTVLPSPSTSIGKGIVPVDSAPPPRIMSHSSPPAKTTSAISVSKPPLLPVGISDEEMARRLQEEEDQMFQRMQREREQQQQRQRGGGGGGVPRQPTQHPQQRYGGGSASTVTGSGSYSGGLTGGSNRMSSAMSNHYDSRSSSGQYRTASHHHQGSGGAGSATSGTSTGGSTAHSRHPRSGSGSSASGSATNRPHENDEGNDSNNRSGSSRSNSKNCIIS